MVSSYDMLDPWVRNVPLWDCAFWPSGHSCSKALVFLLDNMLKDAATAVYVEHVG